MEISLLLLNKFVITFYKCLWWFCTINNSSRINSIAPTKRPSSSTSIAKQVGFQWKRIALFKCFSDLGKIWWPLIPLQRAWFIPKWFLKFTNIWRFIKAFNYFRLWLTVISFSVVVLLTSFTFVYHLYCVTTAFRQISSSKPVSKITALAVSNISLSNLSTFSFSRSMT